MYKYSLPYPILPYPTLFYPTLPYYPPPSVLRFRLFADRRTDAQHNKWISGGGLNLSSKNGLEYQF